MKHFKKEYIPLLYTSLLYVFGLLLFLEWLYPIGQVTDTGYIKLFIFYTLFCFLISLLQFPTIVSFLLKGFGLLLIVNYLFYNEPFLNTTWLSEFYAELLFNLNLLFIQEWSAFTPSFRSLQFLLLIWLISYLVYYWFIITQRPLIFILLTFIYITLLDTFTEYDASIAIVRIFVVSLLSLGLANLFKEISKASLPASTFKQAPTWLLSLLSVVLLSAIVGYMTPIYESQWADPVPYIKHVTGKNNSDSNGSLKRVGYGEDDTVLGGAFIQDFTPVFHAVAERKQYWRIETKDAYTGKGWESSGQPSFEEQPNGHITFRTFSKSVQADHSETTITFLGNTYINKLVYPYGIDQVSTEEERVQFLFDHETEGIYTEINDGEVSLSMYTMTYEEPSFSIEELQKASKEDPKYIQERYTQLPTELPERIGVLAKEITNDNTNRYDQAVEIESYFGESGFVYQISDVPVPESGQDYVDQFLFDSQAGYCDNYSTSMVIMLRTLNIPARWVKGFTGGEKIEEASVGGVKKNIYEVQNANAHSWVEVYFPEIGWVPFEPTKGFSNSTDFHSNIDEDEQDMEVEEVPEELDEQENEVIIPDLEDAETEAAEAADKKAGKVKRWHILTFIGLLLVLSVVLYKTRYRWKTFFLSIQFKHQYNRNSYEKAYHHLLSVLSYKGLPKKRDQTIREYADRIDNRFDSSEMGRLTSYYEQIIYNNSKWDDTNGQELFTLWRALMKRIMK